MSFYNLFLNYDFDLVMICNESFLSLIIIIIIIIII